MSDSQSELHEQAVRDSFKYWLLEKGYALAPEIENPTLVDVEWDMRREEFEKDLKERADMKAFKWRQ